MQQPFRSGDNLPEYNKVFRQHIIPNNPTEHNCYDAHNINFVDNLQDNESRIVVIDSASRNWDKENNNNYTINLNQTFNYVYSIELVDGYVPATGYIVTDHNNVICFQEEDNSPTYVPIKTGNYTIKKLLKTISESMTDLSPNHYSYQCSVDDNNNKVTIECDHHFDLIFAEGTEVVGDRGMMETMVINPKTNRKEIQQVIVSDSRQKYLRDSIGKLIGFKPMNLEHEKRYTGQMIYDLHPYNYVAIFLNTENADSFANIIAPSPDNGAGDAFAIVPLTNGCFVFNRVVDNGRFRLSFNPPIHFNKLKLQFRTADGHLYDFNGAEHFLVFEIRQVFAKEEVRTLKNLY